MARCSSRRQIGGFKGPKTLQAWEPHSFFYPHYFVLQMIIYYYKLIVKHQI